MELPKRKSLRLEGYDYSQTGLYFLTICLQDRKCLFGKIENGIYEKYPSYHMIEKWYNKLNEKFPNISCMDHAIMPNHFHCIIEIKSQTETSIGDIMDWFKTMTTNDYINGVKQFGWPRFNGKLWQKSYYDNIIDSDDAYYNISDYIANNPSRWAEDRFYSIL